MKFKLDENLPAVAAVHLLAAGHDVHTVHDEGLQGADDTAVMGAAIREGRVLVTLDLDFADVRRYVPGTHAGVWVLRPEVQTFAAIVALLGAGLRLLATEPAAGQLWVIDEKKVRIRDA